MKLGFIGMGNMATALCRGLVASKKIMGKDICAFDPMGEKLQKTAAELGFIPLASSREVAMTADVVLMACKPQQLPSALAELGDALAGKALVSIALGYDFAKYQPLLPKSTRVQFVMPNTPAAVGAGVFLFEETHSLTPEELTFVKGLFEALGTVLTLPSSQMGIGGALSGCGPAYVSMMIEAFADAGVKYGLPRDKAMKMMAATVLGTAKLQLETGMHPGALKDMVCSPGGSTIKGVTALEQAGFRADCISAIDAIMK